MPVRLDHIAEGGMELGGSGEVAFVHGSGPALADVVLEWDFDNDGDFDRPEEDITGFMVATQTRTGRDWPSQLTGKASPGELRASVRNDDNRFGHFNRTSPLNQAPFSLDTGRKVRLRTATAANPDPLLLGRDRFRRPDGPLGAAETGQVWEWPGERFSAFLIEDQIARAGALDTDGEGGGQHLNVIDTGATDYYVQIRIGRMPVGATNSSVGLVFRYLDVDNWQSLRFNLAGQSPHDLVWLDVVAGVPSTVTLPGVDVWDGMTIGVVVEDDTARLTIEGVPIGFANNTVTALQPTATRVGIWGEWQAGIPPEIEQIHVWDRHPAMDGVIQFRNSDRTEGIIWTGDIDDITPDAALGPDNTAELRGSGKLAALATHSVTFPGLLRGGFAGTAVGKVLSDSNLLTPPGWLWAGLNIGTVGIPEADAIDVARKFEEAERGFLHEAQEGWINFDGSDSRASSTPQATFSDDPNAQFSYYDLRLLDWRREIFNQVKAGVAPTPPNVIVVSQHNIGAFPAVEANLGSALFIDPGDLLLMFATCSGSGAIDLRWLVPEGWVHLTDDKPLRTTPNVAGNNFRIYAKIADGSESGILPFATASADIAFTTVVWGIRDWFGDIAEGVALGDETRSDQAKPIQASWDPQPSLFLATRWGQGGTSIVAFWSGLAGDGYYRADEAINSATGGANLSIQTAAKQAVVHPVEAPSPFDGVFAGFNAVTTRLLAIRGFNGSPPVLDGAETVTVDDLTSQDRYNSIKSYVAESNLFRTTANAEAYGEAILEQYATARPVVAISFHAHKNEAYRAQAIRRRVGDMITLVADRTTGMGISGEFFIENIVHHFEKDQTIWDVTWELSPA